MDDEQNNELIVVDQIREMPTKPDKVPIDQQAKNLIVSGAKCVPGAGNILGEMASQVLKVGEYSPEQRLRNLQFDWLVEVLPPILKRIERLIDEGVQVESPDIGAIFEAALDASRKTTGKKRKYLKKALENAFSLKMYEEGQVLRFFRMLGELEYGDILVLSCVLESKDRLFSPTNNKFSNVLNPAAFPEAVRENLYFHAKVLETHFLTTYIKSMSHFQANPIARDFIWFVTADDEDLENDDE